MAAESPGDLLSQQPPRLFVFPGWMQGLAWPFRALLVLLLIATASGIAYLAATRYPDTAPPRGSELEQQVATVFGLPADGADGAIVGDLLVERFYAIDVETGERYVADILKGRVQALQSATNEYGVLVYTLLIDMRNVRRDRAFFAAYVEEVAHPSAEAGYYLGLRAPMGLVDAALLNYDGTLPEERRAFRGQDGEDLREFLASQRFSEISRTPRLVGVDGYNYLLSSTERFPFFRSEFGLNKAYFLSEHVLVDTTARPQQTAYYRLFERYPTQPR